MLKLWCGISVHSPGKWEWGLPRSGVLVVEVARCLMERVMKVEEVEPVAESEVGHSVVRWMMAVYDLISFPVGDLNSPFRILFDTSLCSRLKSLMEDQLVGRSCVDGGHGEVFREGSQHGSFCGFDMLVEFDSDIAEVSFGGHVFVA